MTCNWKKHCSMFPSFACSFPMGFSLWLVFCRVLPNSLCILDSRMTTHLSAQKTTHTNLWRTKNPSHTERWTAWKARNIDKNKHRNRKGKKPHKQKGWTQVTWKIIGHSQPLQTCSITEKIETPREFCLWSISVCGTCSLPRLSQSKPGCGRR